MILGWLQEKHNSRRFLKGVAVEGAEKGCCCLVGESPGPKAPAVPSALLEGLKPLPPTERQFCASFCTLCSAKCKYGDSGFARMTAEVRGVYSNR